jgi:hypothetical protein
MHRVILRRQSADAILVENRRWIHRVTFVANLDAAVKRPVCHAVISCHAKAEGLTK